MKDKDVFLLYRQDFQEHQQHHAVIIGTAHSEAATAW
jgi:hypothetical protein